MISMNDIGSWLSSVLNVHHRISALNRKSTDSINSQVKMMQLMVSLVEKMPDHREEFLVRFKELYDDYIQKALDRERELLNPLTPIELKRLEEYYAMYRGGKQLDLQQATDFKNLAERLEADKKNRSGEEVLGAVALLGLAVLLLAILTKKGK